MNYQSVAPRAPLVPFVECFWLLSSDSAEAATAPLEPILPDGCIELIVQLRDPMRRVGAAREQPRVFLCGQVTAPLLLEPSGNIRTFGVRFRPGGARPFFEGDLGDLVDVDTPLPDLWGRFGEEVEERVREAEGFSAKVRAAERVLCVRLRERWRDMRVEGAVKGVLASRGLARVGALARTAGLSDRQLERRFRSAVGLAPKLFSRVVRFQRVVRVARRSARAGWADTAARCGYADQAHLVRDVRAFSGATPSALRADRGFTAPFVAEERLAALFGDGDGFVQDGRGKERDS